MIRAGLSMGAAPALSVHLVARGGPEADATRSLPWRELTCAGRRLDDAISCHGQLLRAERPRR
jgi:hypothetical protein